MIIEDSKVIRDELDSLLIIYGYEVTAPEEFENILDYVKSEKPSNTVRHKLTSI